MQRHYGGEISARAVAANRDAVRFGALRDELGCGDAILHRGGKRRLRREAVLDGENFAARAVGELAAKHVVRVEVTNGPAAAVEVHERG